MKKDIQFSTMMIELDALFDTRLACLAHLDNSKLQEILTKGYHTRSIDEFPYVSFNSFRKLYEKRDRQILKDAVITPIGMFAREFAVKTLQQVVNSPFHYKPKVTINLYPYELPEEEVNTIIAAVVELTSGLCDVEIVTLSHEQLTVGYVKKNLSILVMYEYAPWLELHSKSGAFHKLTCPEITLIAPAIHFKPLVPHKYEENPYSAMEQLAAPLIGLQLMPIELFSLAVKITPPTPTP